MKVRGRSIPVPRPTRWAGIVFVLRYGVPIVAFGAAVDLVLLALRGG